MARGIAVSDSKWVNSATDFQEFVAFFSEFGGHRTARHIEWQYLEPPVDTQAKVLLAIDSALPARPIKAVYASFSSRFMVNGKTTVAAQSLDTLTAPAYRGKGLFFELAKSVNAELERSGQALIYGFPNAQSGPGFYSKLGWQQVGTVPFLWRPMNLGYLVRRVPKVGSLGKALNWLRAPLWRKRVQPGWTVNHDAPFDLRFDALWQSLRSSYATGLVRDRRYLQWRLADKPGFEYRNVTLSNASGEIVACCIYSIQAKHEGRVGYVMDVLIRRNETEAGTVALNAALAAMNAAAVDLVLAWNLPDSFNTACYQANGFWKLPDAMRPIHLSFGFRPFAEPGPSSSSGADGWYISYFDSDTV
ncbi:MAG: hypothetical protein CFE44_09185 [Burkholderiales bacterium PBB4]|nr:MAG: hypothetical protein CFE44_09185 [Burkholderiales bacterium PBB4]